MCRNILFCKLWKLSYASKGMIHHWETLQDLCSIFTELSRTKSIPKQKSYPYKRKAYFKILVTIWWVIRQGFSKGNVPTRCYLWLSKLSANERWRYVSNISRHWLRLCSAINRKRYQDSLLNNQWLPSTLVSTDIAWLLINKRQVSRPWVICAHWTQRSEAKEFFVSESTWKR